MKAVIALCPNLMEVHFHTPKRLFYYPIQIVPLQPNDADVLSDNKLRLLLSSSIGHWSKVNSKEWDILIFAIRIIGDLTVFSFLFFSFQVEFINFFNVSPSVRQIVLDSIGGHRLRELFLFDCRDVDPVAELPRFNRLENLWIECPTMIHIGDEDFLVLRLPPGILADSGLFLPNLKTLSTAGNCLDHWSRLFECHRPSLTSLQLSCCHFGLPSMSQFNWDDTPRLWPNLMQLTLIGSCLVSYFNFNLAKVMDQIVPQLQHFKNFQKLVVHKVFDQKANKLISQIEPKFFTRINIEYLFTPDVHFSYLRAFPPRCLYLLPT